MEGEMTRTELVREFAQNFGEACPEVVGLVVQVENGNLDEVREYLHPHAVLYPDYVLSCLDTSRFGELREEARHAKACMDLLELLDLIETTLGKEQEATSADAG